MLQWEGRTTHSISKNWNVITGVHAYLRVDSEFRHGLEMVCSSMDFKSMGTGMVSR